ncbi:hypothetical protein JCM11491_006367 [Sporobolomyces phaffii]
MQALHLLEAQLLRHDFSPSWWDFLRPPVKDRAHLSDCETFDSDHDEWASGADPSAHDIADLESDVVDRNWNAWDVVERRLGWRMNRDNDGGTGMLPEAWGLGAMRRVEARQAREEAARRARNDQKERVRATRRQTRGTKSKGRKRRTRKGKEKEDAAEEADTEEATAGDTPRKKEPFLVRVQRYYDIDEPFTDDSEIERELDAEPAVGLGALARPLIRTERDRRKRRRAEGREDDDTTDDEES